MTQNRALTLNLFEKKVNIAITSLASVKTENCYINLRFAYLLTYLLTYLLIYLLPGSVDDTIDWAEIEQELDSSNPVRIVSYKSPLDQTIFLPSDSEDSPTSLKDPPLLPRHHPKNVQYHSVWLAADRLVDRNRMWPDDSPEVDAILSALAHAPIVGVDLLDVGGNEYESGTADKWIVTLDGRQKAVMKIVWLVGTRYSLPKIIKLSL